MGWDCINLCCWLAAVTSSSAMIQWTVSCSTKGHFWWRHLKPTTSFTMLPTNQVLLRAFRRPQPTVMHHHGQSLRCLWVMRWFNHRRMRTKKNTSSGWITSMYHIKEYVQCLCDAEVYPDYCYTHPLLPGKQRWSKSPRENYRRVTLLSCTRLFKIFVQISGWACKHLCMLHM